MLHNRIGMHLKGDPRKNGQNVSGAPPYLPELPDHRIRNPKFLIDCHDQAVQREDNFPGILLVHVPLLGPDHLLQEQGGQVSTSVPRNRSGDAPPRNPRRRARPVPGAGRSALRSA